MTPYKQGIYALFDGDDLVYIGKATSLYSRIANHISEGTKKFDSFELFPLNMNDWNISRIELNLIGYFNPKYNIHGSYSEKPTHKHSSKKSYVNAINRLIDIEVNRDDESKWAHGLTRCKECIYNPENQPNEENDAVGIHWTRKAESRWKQWCKLPGWLDDLTEFDGCTRGKKQEDK